jgi:hypothetical protein
MSQWLRSNAARIGLALWQVAVAVVMSLSVSNVLYAQACCPTVTNGATSCGYTGSWYSCSSVSGCGATCCAVDSYEANCVPAGTGPIRIRASVSVSNCGGHCP